MSFRTGKQTKGPSAHVPAVFGATNVGKVRSGNEDSYKILVGQEASSDIDAIMVVADGMGGHAAGEVASAMAVDGIVRHLTSRAPESTMPGGDYFHLLGQMLSEVNREVCLAGRDPEHHGMGTTCTAAVLMGSQLHVAHVGDSRAYILKAGKLVQITRDHSWVSEQVEAGNLTLEQATNHPHRNVVTRAVGTDENVQVDAFVERVASGDRVLLCSDGLHSVVADVNIETELKNEDIKSACDRLIALANANGGPDNITVTVADIRGPDRSASTRPVDSDVKDTQPKKQRRLSGLPGRLISRLARRK